MSNDITDEPAPVSSLPRLQFSLLAALLFTTLVCLALGYAFRTRYAHATALYRVSSQKWSMWDGDARQFDAQQYDLLQKTQVALIKSYFVLQSAVRNPAIAGLPILAGKDDPVAWLQENLEVGFPGNAEIMEIRLRDRDIFANDLKLVVDAVANAYENEVVAMDRNRQLIQRDALARALGNLHDELDLKLQGLQELKSAKNQDQDTVKVMIRQQEVDTLMGIVRELSRRIQIIDINTDAPKESAQIQKLQPAVPTFE